MAPFVAPVVDRIGFFLPGQIGAVETLVTVTNFPLTVKGYARATGEPSDRNHGYMGGGGAT
jgi:hypothetical protein